MTKTHRHADSKVICLRIPLQGKHGHTHIRWHTRHTHTQRLIIASKREASVCPSDERAHLLDDAHWSRMWEFLISWLSLRATPMCDSGESKAASVGVRMISAPSAFRTSTYFFLEGGGRGRCGELKELFFGEAFWVAFRLFGGRFFVCLFVWLAGWREVTASDRKLKKSTQ